MIRLSPDIGGEVAAAQAVEAASDDPVKAALSTAAKPVDPAMFRPGVPGNPFETRIRGKQTAASLWVHPGRLSGLDSPRATARAIRLLQHERPP